MFAFRGRSCVAWMDGAKAREDGQVTVDMGPPELNGPKVPATLPTNADGVVLNEPIKVGVRVYLCMRFLPPSMCKNNKVRSEYTLWACPLAEESVPWALPVGFVKGDDSADEAPCVSLSENGIGNHSNDKVKIHEIIGQAPMPCRNNPALSKRHADQTRCGPRRWGRREGEDKGDPFMRC